jgi:hypothetical protein
MSAPGNTAVGLRDGGSVVATSATDIQWAGAARQWRSVTFRIAGLVAGVAKTYKLAFSGSGAQTMTIRTGAGTADAATIEVYAA